MLYYKNDIRYRPFLSFTTLRIVGLIIFGITQLLMAFYILLYTSIIPMEELNSDNVNNIFDLFLDLFVGDELEATVSEYKSLITIWPTVKIIYNVSRLVPPLLIAGLFGRLIQNPAKLKIIFFRYFSMTIILFIAELLFYYSFFDAMLEEIQTTNNLDETI
ncbi:MAG: hypothetical protein K6A63_01120, partial [Acholeplasmatales bacterium]|nr:hypothetical protein [Acholeplasmatales bacterium]